VRSKTPPRAMPMQLSRAQCTPLSATPHRCRKAAKVLTRVVQSFAMLSRLKPLLMHCGPPDSIVFVLVRAPIRYAGHAESKSGLIILLLQSPEALLWHRPAPEDVDYASGPCVIRSAEVPSYHAQRTHAKTQRVRVKSWCSRFCIGPPYSTLLPIVDTKSLSHRSFTPAPPVAARQRTPMPTTIP
jgi:hypothetical protein